MAPFCCPHSHDAALMNEHPVLTSLRLRSDAMVCRLPRPHALDATWSVMLYVSCPLRQDRLQVLTKPVFSVTGRGRARLSRGEEALPVSLIGRMTIQHKAISRSELY